MVSQGDIFVGVPIIGVSLSQLRQVVQEGDGLRTIPVEPDQLAANMVLLEHVSTTNAIVISQSCDAERAPRLMLAPLTDFGLEEKNAIKKWRKISHTATSLGEPKNIYLPGNPTIGLSRSLADFGEAFTLPRDFLEELARRGKRIAGLSEQAIAYLQFRLAVLLTRVARDDFGWPSKDDLKIKVESLNEQISEAEKKKAKKIAEATKEAGVERENRLADAEQLEAELAFLRRNMDQAIQARPTADDLAGS